MRWLWFALLVYGCADEPASVRVDLRTDLIPNVEFDQVEVNLTPRGGTTLSVGHTPTSNDYLDGLPVAEFNDLPTTTARVEVELFRGSERIASRPLAAELRSGRQGFTITLSRRCRQVECAQGLACFDGECVDERCRDDNLAACGDEVDCTTDSECPNASACARAVCIVGSCLFDTVTECGVGEYCDPEEGCRDIPTPPGETDADTPIIDAAVPLDVPTLDGELPDIGLDADDAANSDDATNADASDSSMTDSGVRDASDASEVIDAGTDSAMGVCTEPASPGICVDGICWWNPLPKSSRIEELVVVGPDNVVAVTDSFEALQWGGSDWMRTDLGPGGLESVWAISPTDIWAVGDQTRTAHFNGAGWATDQISESDPARLISVWGSASDDVWALSQTGSVYRYNGMDWSLFHTAPADAYNQLTGVDANQVWLVHDSGIHRYLSGSWEAITAPVTAEWAAALALSTGEVWVLGDGVDQLYRWTGTDWSALDPPDQEYRHITGSSAQDLWLAGRTRVAHWNGTIWSEHDAPFRVSTIAASGSEVWIASHAGQRAFWNGASWTPTQSSTLANLEDIWGLACDDVWVVGDRGTVLRFNGAEWTDFPNPISTDLHAIWGNSSANLWVGGTGFITHWNGSQWTPDSFPDAGLLVEDIDGLAGMEPFAVADTGIYRRSSGTWTRITTLPFEGTALAVAEGEVVWVVGKDAGLAMWDGALQTIAIPGAGSATQQAIAPAGGGAWISGDLIRFYDGNDFTDRPTGFDWFGWADLSFTEGVPWSLSREAVIRWSGVQWVSYGERAGDDMNALWVAPDSSHAWAVGKGGQIARVQVP